MRCEIAKEQIQEWLDQAGKESLPSELGEHLRTCADCCQFVSTWNGIELRIRQMKEAAPVISPDFRTRLAYRIADEKTKKRPAAATLWLHARWRPVAMAAASIVLLLAGFGLYRGVEHNRLLALQKGATGVSGTSNNSPAIFRNEFPLANTSK